MGKGAGGGGSSCWTCSSAWPAGGLNRSASIFGGTYAYPGRLSRLPRLVYDLDYVINEIEDDIPDDC